ncbi:SGNH/GDSL hydrolase family protein [Streptomyces bottropensis]|uniref:SGNH/GDSL hydrolase family protein n=1 Tax=Streptomyces bottropensis TaxID=42235 RepID=UPI00369B29BC
MDPWTAAHHPARYRADAVVIDLGTDDVGHGVSSAQFQAGCSSLLRTVRAAHPQAWIFARETFRGRFVPQARAAVQRPAARGDSRLSSVDTTGAGWAPATSPTPSTPTTGGTVSSPTGSPRSSPPGSAPDPVPGPTMGSCPSSSSQVSR